MDNTNFFSGLFQKDTLSYKYINEECVDNMSFQHTNIIGCTIKNCSFINANFNSADFDGTIISACKFIQGDWSRTDSCSLTVSNTLFDKIDFSLSTMRNCDFKNCIFNNCSFEHIALSGTYFEECTFNEINLIQSSTYLNSYIGCTFNNCSIDGNFYYNILGKNIYRDSRFGQKLFAYNYFFVNANTQLSDLGLDGLQNKELKMYLRDNNLLINLVILGLNETGDVDMSTIRFVAAIGEILKLGVLIREEQLQFVLNFVQFLLKKEMISSVTIAESISYLEKIFTWFNTQQNVAYTKCKDTLNIIRNQLLEAYQTIGQMISYKHDESKVDEEVIVKIIYDKEPEVPICAIVNEIRLALGVDAPDAKRVKTEIGSFHEWISCYDSVLQCLQLFIAVLGLGYTVIHDKKMKHRKEYVEVRDEQEISSDKMLMLLNKALSKQKINPEFSQTLQIVVKNDVVASKKFRGYSRSNVQSIEITTKNS